MTFTASDDNGNDNDGKNPTLRKVLGDTMKRSFDYKIDAQADVFAFITHFADSYHKDEATSFDAALAIVGLIDSKMNYGTSSAGCGSILFTILAYKIVAGSASGPEANHWGVEYV